MIFSDGAGATILEWQENSSSGILSTAAVSHCIDEVDYINFGKSNFPFLTLASAISNERTKGL